MVSDKRLRAKLIASAEFIENGLANKTISPDQNLNRMEPYGLKVSVFIETREGKPDIFHYTYSMDESTLLSWMQSMKYLMEGPLIFTGCGLEIFLPEGIDHYKNMAVKFKAMSMARHQYNAWRSILEKPLVFRVFREVINQKEWEIFYDEQ